MRCCKSCGCYLPDGVSKCLACGYDENTIGFHYGYGLSQWNGEVRSPMGIVQAPVMPTKTENRCKVYTAVTNGQCINVKSKEIWRHEYIGFSYDDKPKHGVPDGSTFYEMDTCNTYMFIKEYCMWFLQF